MGKLLLSLHVVAAVVFVGPVTVAVSPAAGGRPAGAGGRRSPLRCRGYVGGRWPPPGPVLRRLRSALGGRGRADGGPARFDHGGV